MLSEMRCWVTACQYARSGCWLMAPFFAIGVSDLSGQHLGESVGYVLRLSGQKGPRIWRQVATDATSSLDRFWLLENKNNRKWHHSVLICVPI